MSVHMYNVPCCVYNFTDEGLSHVINYIFCTFFSYLRLVVIVVICHIFLLIDFFLLQWQIVFGFLITDKDNSIESNLFGFPF